MAPARRRPETPVVDDHDGERDVDDISEDENDENRPINTENPMLHAHTDLLVLRTPLSHSRASHETALRDITDQFFHPPSPSPVRVSKLKRAAPTIEPPRRPKKPKSLAYPADPPNWLRSRSSSILPPSSPFPPSTTLADHAHPTDHSIRHTTAPRHAYYLGTPSRASDSDPFGFVAIERALKAKHVDPALVPHKPTSCISAVKSPPRSTILPSPPTPAHSPVFASFSQLDVPVPTNNEDIDGLYVDEPVAGPSHGRAPVPPLLLMNSDQPFREVDATHSQPTFPDPLRTPRKRRPRASPTPSGGLESDGTDVPSSPSPVKISTATGRHTRRRSEAVLSIRAPVLKLTRAQTRAAKAGIGTGEPPTNHASRTRRINTSRQHVPTPSSTRSRQSTAPPTPGPLRRSTRQAAVGARAELKGITKTGDGDGRMTLRPRSTKTNETKTAKSTSRSKRLPSTSKGSSPKTQKTTTTKPARGRPKGKLNVKDSKGKGKARRENVLDLSDDTRERYDKERRERLEYFKRLEGYQIQKENVYVV